MLNPDARPRIISDNGRQYVACDFREFFRLSGMTHVRTSPYSPQSNGKIERFHGSLKRECIRPRTPVSLEDARRVVGQFVVHCNNVRLHSAGGYVAPAAVLGGRAEAIHAQRQRILQEARLCHEGESPLTRKEVVHTLLLVGPAPTPVGLASLAP